MPGQGKTTLAQLVYKNDEIVRHFGHRLWICVSDDFCVDRLLNEMVEYVTKSGSDMKNREAMVKRLQDELNDKSFLLVLDDVWNKNHVEWSTMKRCLLEIRRGSRSGSKIMVTTRSEDVCLTMQTRLTHHLSTLSDEESWTLFRLVAFANGGAVETTELVSTGKRILSRCGGVPLAIKALAGVLYARKEEREWLLIEKSEWGSSVSEEDTVLPSLRLSYNHLPFLSLKQCFGYCSLFPKGLILEKDKLIQLWIAQGFLSDFDENHMEMEDVGTSYLNILLRNSLLQVDEKDEYCNVRTCKMHDLVHDLSSDITKNYCLSTNDEEVNAKTKIVNLSLMAGERTLTRMSRDDALRLRTLFSGSVLHGDLLIKFKKLRVLILNNSDILEISNSIGKLKHLRLLDVSETRIFRLPDSLTKLYNLQTLRLHGLIALPKDFGKLINLRHFLIQSIEVHSDDNTFKCLLPGVGQLNCLRSLPYFIVSQEEGCHIRELQGLNNLRGALRIYGLEAIQNGIEASEANIEGKPNIDTLKYQWSSRVDEAYYDDANDKDVLEGLRPHSNIRSIKIEGYHSTSLPLWIMEPGCRSLLRNLVKIVFKLCDMCAQVPPLGCLPFLRIAKMKSMGSVIIIGNEFYGLNHLDGASNTSNQVIVFPALRQLTLRSMSSLEGWLDIDDSQCLHLQFKEFPQLEMLKISGCDNLTYIRGMESLTSLQELSVSFCSELVSLPMDLGLLESLEVIRIRKCDNLAVFPSIRGLRSLRKLSIEECLELTYLPEGIESLELLQELSVIDLPNLQAFPDVRSLRSLCQLVINGCLMLSALPSGLEFCTSLDYVMISGCPLLLLDGLHCLPNLRELILGPLLDVLDYFPLCSTDPGAVSDSFENEDFKGHFVSLKKMTLNGWSKLTSLPQQLQYYSLTYLSICNFESLLALPDWLGNLKSLQIISIWYCNNLLYFPSAETMQSLNNLQKLIVKHCPQLEERCVPETGPEWNKIAHIPEISINAILKYEGRMISSCCLTVEVWNKELKPCFTYCYSLTNRRVLGDDNGTVENQIQPRTNNELLDEDVKCKFI